MKVLNNTKKFKKIESLSEFDEYLKFKYVRQKIKFNKSLELANKLNKKSIHEYNYQNIKVLLNLFFERKEPTYFEKGDSQCLSGKIRSISDFYNLLNYYCAFSLNHKIIFNIWYNYFLCENYNKVLRVCPSIQNINFTPRWTSAEIIKTSEELENCYRKLYGLNKKVKINITSLRGYSKFKIFTVNAFFYNGIKHTLKKFNNDKIIMLYEYKNF